MIIHVDDLLATYSESFLHLLEIMLVWGSTAVTRKELQLRQEGGRFKYYVTQVEFIEGMEGGKVSRGRCQQPAFVTPAEWAHFRSVTGSLDCRTDASRD